MGSSLPFQYGKCNLLPLAELREKKHRELYKLVVHSIVPSAIQHGWMDDYTLWLLYFDSQYQQLSEYLEQQMHLKGREGADRAMHRKNFSSFFSNRTKFI